MSTTVPRRDWWYVRVYPGGPRLMDAAVRTLVPWLAGQAGRLGSEDWFFIRYWDATGHHVRLRLRAGADAVDALDAVAREELTGLLDTLEERPADSVGLLPGVLPAGSPTRGITPALYAPESAKYGGPDGVALAERIFRLDSDFCARLDLAGLPRRYERAAHAVYFARALTARVLDRGGAGRLLGPAPHPVGLAAAPGRRRSWAVAHGPCSVGLAAGVWDCLASVVSGLPQEVPVDAHLPRSAELLNTRMPVTAIYEPPELCRAPVPRSAGQAAVTARPA
ncbi:lantibiotic dehydratase C-terminal domain-containing protein [Streptomyces narbonensis]